VDAEFAANRLRSLLGPGALVGVHNESNSIILRADVNNVERAKVLLARLDVTRNHYVDRLENANAMRVAEVVGVVITVAAFLTDDIPPRVFPLEDQSITLTATKAQADWLRWLMRQLDQR